MLQLSVAEKNVYGVLEMHLGPLHRYESYILTLTLSVFSRAADNSPGPVCRLE